MRREINPTIVPINIAIIIETINANNGGNPALPIKNPTAYAPKPINPAVPRLASPEYPNNSVKPNAIIK